MDKVSWFRDLLETERVWLTRLFEEAIEEEKATIENEKLFMRGSTNMDEAVMHDMNITMHLHYINTVRSLLNIVKTEETNEN